jgi:serine protease Do
MQRTWMIGMAMAAAAMAGLGGRAARAGDEGGKDAPRAHREVVRLFGGGGGRLGVSLEEVGADDVGRLKLSAERGAVVRDVQEGSAAEKAGIKEGDVIVRFGSQEVWSAAQLARLVRETPPGRRVEVAVSRDGSVQTLGVTLARPDRDRMMSFGPEGAFDFQVPDVPALADLPRPPRAPRAPHPPMPPSLDDEGMGRMFLRGWPGQGRRLGLSYQELGEQLARYFKVDGGVLVTSVDEDGPAAKAGLKAGDVIVRFDGKAVKDGSDLRDALAGVEAGKAATMGIQRDGRAMDLTVATGGDPRAKGGARGFRRGERT